jgi:glycosyltransferase involved in cell wall biosynthesis
LPEQPVVSVVCATYRRPAAVRRLLASLERQDLEAPFEVILSDDGSGEQCVLDVKAAIASSSLEVRLLEHQRNRGPGAARNDGWRAARADVVAFTDDDCQPEPGWLRAGLALMHNGVVVVGRVIPDPAQSGALGPWSRTLTVSDARFFQTANAFYARADLDAVGGFDERFVLAGGEDTDLGMRVLALGRAGVFAPDALVLHDVRGGTVWSLAKERATKWVDLPLVLRKHPQLRHQNLYLGLFWKRSHPAVILALVGLLALPLALVPWGWLVLLLTFPWLLDRGIKHPPPGGLRRRISLLPGTFLVEAAEIVSMVRGSVRHRTLML